MKTFKIAKKTNEVISTAQLYFTEAGTSGNDLYIVVSKENGSDLNEGDKLIFEKTASGNSGEMLRVCEETVEIKNIVPVGDYLYVYFEYLYITPLILTRFSEIVSPEGYNYKLFFNVGHNMLPCDLDGVSEYAIYVRRGENIIKFTGLALCFPGEVIKGKDITPIGTDCCDETVGRFNYETMERNAILARSSGNVAGSGFTPEPGDQVLFATNPYFYIDSEHIPGTTNNRINFYGCSGETVSILRNADFMGLGITLEQDYDAKRMFQEYQVNELFVKKIKDSIIPDFIDLEKVKYAPAFIDSSTRTTMTYLATGLTFNLHFRTRVQGANKYTFEDVWHVTDETNTWNGNGPDETVKFSDLYKSPGFVNSSNLIGFLGFTDDDIYNQKNRVKQSFLRLSFYDSTDPLTQNLLYYSTIFLDSGDLFGKYVERKTWLEENVENYNHLENPVVWSSAATTDPCSAVTCQLMVNDEYDMTRSGEGFNLYLFRQDAPIENDVQTIYMKVEFNHAGIGRTVPLIYWPKEGNKPKTLTIENYLETLYIPIKITLSEKGYVYSFPGAVTDRNNGIVWENERLVFNLFEPMIYAEK